MRLGLRPLRSKVGRRLFALFVVCAMVPIGILALVSFRSVSRELERQSQERLRQLAKTQVMAIAERLELLDIELRLAAERLPHAPRSDQEKIDRLLTGLDEDRVLGLSLEPVGEPAGQAVSAHPGAFSLTSEARQHLATGRSVLAIRKDSDAPATVALGQLVDSSGPVRKLLWARINPLFLWWGPLLDNTLPPATELCVLDWSQQVELFCPTGAEVLSQRFSTTREGALGELSWKRDGTAFLTSYRSANFRSRFGHEGITVVVSQERAYLLSPLADFKRSFPPIILASLAAVLLLSIGQIRKRLTPLEKLRRGTQKIASRDFSTRVEIDSGDEFEQLAGSFNSMADRLGKQFGALRAMQDIVQAVLAALDRRKIALAVLTHFAELLPCEVVAVTVLDDDDPRSSRIYLRGLDEQGVTEAAVAALGPPEVDTLDANRQLLMIETSAGLPPHLRNLERLAVGTVAVFPVFVDSRLAGMVSAGLRQGEVPQRDDLERVRQVVDQVAVAFANVELLEQLEEMSWGALTALARSIDAKSHWTAGHSERVARMATVVGREMGLSDEQLDILHRGSLLHDLGKIGVSSKILDKPGPLTDTEMKMVRGHVWIGARILEPITQLRQLMPLIEQHHEWFNGAGYPQRLSGDQIDLLARVMAVADVYDALRSPRPYREALKHEVVLQMIGEGAGTQFDPQVVGAFFKSAAWKVRGPAPETEPHLRTLRA